MQLNLTESARVVSAVVSYCNLTGFVLKTFVMSAVFLNVAAAHHNLQDILSEPIFLPLKTHNSSENISLTAPKIVNRSTIVN